MDVKDLSLIEENLEKDTELKDLWQEHLKFEKQLQKVERKLFLSPQEKVEKKRLQLAKLTGKTKIDGILDKYRGSAMMS